MSQTSIPLPVAGGKVSFSDWPKNNSDNDHRVSNKEKVFNRISNKYHPYKKKTENQFQNSYDVEENTDKDNEYVSSFLSKLPIHKNQSPKKNSSTLNNASYGDTYYKGADGKLVYDGPPHVTLDELSSSPEKQPFSSKLKTMTFLPNYTNQNNNLLNISLNNNTNKINSIFGNNNKFPNINSNTINSSPNRNPLINSTLVTPTTNNGNNNINKNLNSVIIFGYPIFLENEILNHFKSYGEISSYESQPDNNWTLITYRNNYSTKSALKHKNAFIFKNNIIGVMTYFDYLKLLKPTQPKTATTIPTTNPINNNNILNKNSITNNNGINNTTNSIFNKNINNNNTSPWNNNINNVNNTSPWRNNNMNSTSPWKNNNNNNNINNSNTSSWNNSNNNNNNSNSVNRILFDTSPWKKNTYNNNSPGRFSNSDMNIDTDTNLNPNTRLNSGFNIQQNNLNHSSPDSLFKKNTISYSNLDSPKRNNSLLSNSIIADESRTHTNTTNGSPNRHLLNPASHGRINSLEKFLFKTHNSSETSNNNIINNDFASSSSTNGKSKVSFSTDINSETVQNKPLLNVNNPFIHILNNENNGAKEEEKEKPPFSKRTSLFLGSHHFSNSSVNSSSSSINIPKIGGKTISKPNTSSSNVKDNNSGLLGKMVELVFGW